MSWNLAKEAKAGPGNTMRLLLSSLGSAAFSFDASYSSTWTQSLNFNRLNLDCFVLISWEATLTFPAIQGDLANGHMARLRTKLCTHERVAAAEATNMNQTEARHPKLCIAITMKRVRQRRTHSRIIFRILTAS